MRSMLECSLLEECWCGGDCLSEVDDEAGIVDERIFNGFGLKVDLNELILC
jgi:hypothetical protein